MGVQQIGETQVGFFNLTEEASVFFASPALDAENVRRVVLRLRIGSDEKPLDGSGGTFYLSMQIGDHRVNGTAQAIEVAPGTTILPLELAARNIPAGEQVIANLMSPNPADVDIEVAVTADDAGFVDADVRKLNGSAIATVRLALSAAQMIPGTVDTSVNGHTPTTTVFQADDITEATADHYKGRLVLFTSGALAGQVAEIVAYEQVGGIGQFTVSTMTGAAADDDTFLII